MSAASERWRRYTYLGRLKQARILMHALSKETFVDGDTLTHVLNLARDLDRFYTELEKAIKEKRP